MTQGFGQDVVCRRVEEDMYLAGPVQVHMSPHGQAMAHLSGPPTLTKTPSQLPRGDKGTAQEPGAGSSQPHPNKLGTGAAGLRLGPRTWPGPCTRYIAIILLVP